MLVGSNIDPQAYAQLRELYADNQIALNEIRRSELHDEFMKALESGDDEKQKALLSEAKEKFPDLYEWLIY